MPVTALSDCNVSRVDGAEVFHVEGDRGVAYLVTLADGAATCTCPATGPCKHIRRVVGSSGHVGVDALEVLAAVARDRSLLEQRERTAVASARDQRVPWPKIAVALGMTSEGCRRRHSR